MTTYALILLLLAVLLVPGVALGGPEDAAPPMPGDRLDPSQVTRFARVALAGISREYPNKPGEVLAGPDDVKSPREMHPAFYGCFDWHSAVHGHWTLVRLLKLYPQWQEARPEAVAALRANLTAGNLLREAEYFERPHNRSFERTYGWAWLLRLAQELRTWDDDLGRTWAANLRPLEATLVRLLIDYLPRLRLPIRSGEHRDTAFALAFAIDYARSVRNAELEALCARRARDYYGEDANYPYGYEPSGHDFFSAGLNVADLMRRVLEPEAYRAWLRRFVPGLASGALGPWGRPESVDDVTDGKLVHLAGLNLTRAWTMRGIASALPADAPERKRLAPLVDAHTRGGLAYVFSGDYAGEHWLASFAVFLLTDAGLSTRGG